MAECEHEWRHCLESRAADDPDMGHRLRCSRCQIEATSALSASEAQLRGMREALRAIIRAGSGLSGAGEEYWDAVNRIVMIATQALSASPAPAPRPGPVAPRPEPPLVGDVARIETGGHAVASHTIATPDSTAQGGGMAQCPATTLDRLSGNTTRCGLAPEHEPEPHDDGALRWRDEPPPAPAALDVEAIWLLRFDDDGSWYTGHFWNSQEDAAAARDEMAEAKAFRDGITLSVVGPMRLRAAATPDEGLTGEECDDLLYVLQFLDKPKMTIVTYEKSKRLKDRVRALSEKARR